MKEEIAKILRRLANKLDPPEQPDRGTITATFTDRDGWQRPLTGTVTTNGSHYRLTFLR